MQNITISINKRTIFIAIFVLQVIFIVWYQGLLVPDSRVSPSSSALVMTETEARLTRAAIEEVREAVVVGRLRTTDLTLEALAAELPRSVRERVMRELGRPDMESMRDALDILDGKIIAEGRR
jgi:hypothetical protein